MDLKCQYNPSLPYPYADQKEHPSLAHRFRLVLRGAILLALGFAALYSGLGLVQGSSIQNNGQRSSEFEKTTSASGPLCPQEEELYPSQKIFNIVNKYYDSDDFHSRAIDWLSGAVKIPTESYDDLGPVGTDPRWDVFGDFHDYLRSAFPKSHAVPKVTIVNTYGLVYHWQGSDSSLKPVLLAAHQDVVPVEPKTTEQWNHPPYSGYFDGTYIWGRGSIDDKSGLVAILASLETLIENEFNPVRTIVIAFGFDEEASGMEGAGELAIYLEKNYGRDAFSLLVDEGGSYSGQDGILIATPEVGEKGYLDIKLEVASPGGHSSVPPEHTSIGLLALALTVIEANPHSYASHLTRTSPFYSSVLCMAEHSPSLNNTLRDAVLKSVQSDEALQAVQDILFSSPDLGRQVKSLVGTTQAIDLIQGGVKVNALPESASAVINHRISTDSGVEAVISHLVKLFKPFAEKYNLLLTAFGQNISATTAVSSEEVAGTVTLSDAFGTALEPAPISPTDSTAYKLLSGSIRATYNITASTKPSTTSSSLKLIVSPSIPSGNTDTRFYWNLTQNIYRYNHLNQDGIFGGIHTINEALKAETFVEGVRFFTVLLLNADESKDI